MRVHIIIVFLIFIFDKSGAQVKNSEVLVVKRITKVQNSYPNLSLDGKVMLFHSNRLGNNDIYIKDLETEELKQLTYHKSNDRTPSISPDGHKIAFVSTRDGNYDVFIMNRDGTGIINLTDNKLSKDIHPYWSPDGTKIIYNSTMGGEDYDIYTMNIDGSEKSKIRKEKGEATHAQYSPDGSKVIFRKFFRENNIINSDIALLDLETGTEYRITSNESVDQHPIWINDGISILFTSNRNGANEYDSSIYLYTFNNKHLKKLTFHEPHQEDMTPTYCAINNSVFFARWTEENVIDIYQLMMKP